MDTIWIANPQDVIVAGLSNGSADACPFWDDVRTEQLQPYKDTFEFKVPMDHATAAFIAPQNQVIFADQGAYRLFTIKTVDEVSAPQGQRYRRAYCEAAAYELNGYVYRPGTLNTTVSGMLDSVLTSTRWTRGTVYDTAGTKTLELKTYPTVLKGIHDIAALWGVEVSFEVTLTSGQVMSIASRKVHMWQQRGKATYKVFEYAKDILGVKRIADSIPMYTALVGLGASNDDGSFVTIAPVNGGVDWIGNDTARALYGIRRDATNVDHILGVYQDPDEADATSLLAKTQTALAEVCQPAFTYDVDAAMLDKLPQQVSSDPTAPFQHELVELGDTVLVKDFTFQPPLALSARVIALSRHYTDPLKDKATLGQYRPLFVEAVDPRAQELRMYAREGRWWKDIVPQTVVIAASNSVDPGRADYLCDGTNDYEQFESALGDIGTAGGTIIFLEGTFAFAGRVTYIASSKVSVTIKGSGSATLITGGFTWVIQCKHFLGKDFRATTTDATTEAIYLQHYNTSNGGYDGVPNYDGSFRLSNVKLMSYYRLLVTLAGLGEAYISDTTLTFDHAAYWPYEFLWVVNCRGVKIANSRFDHVTSNNYIGCVTIDTYPDGTYDCDAIITGCEFLNYADIPSGYGPGGCGVGFDAYATGLVSGCKFRSTTDGATAIYGVGNTGVVAINNDILGGGNIL
jgi:phage minor structural protein